MATKIEDKVLDTRDNVLDNLKRHMFDVIGAGMMFIIVLYSLGLFELRDLSWRELGDIFIDWAPFLTCAIVLHNNYYQKGTWSGRSNDTYQRALTTYSNQAGKLTGDKLTSLPEFCKQYNERTLNRLREECLKPADIRLQDFYDCGHLYKSNKELKKLFGKERAKYVIKTKKVKIKGLNSNMLLGNTHSNDDTDIGLDEQSLATWANIKFIIWQSLSLLVMSLIGIKDIVKWGWAGLVLTLFKTIFVFSCAYSAHFKAYTNIVIHGVNYLTRKTDLLKQHEQWYLTYDVNLNLGQQLSIFNN